MKAQGATERGTATGPHLSLTHTHTLYLWSVSLSGLSLWSLSRVGVKYFQTYLSTITSTETLVISTSTVAVAGKYLSTTVSTHGK